jgi:hypothetical protein
MKSRRLKLLKFSKQSPIASKEDLLKNAGGKGSGYTTEVRNLSVTVIAYTGRYPVSM